MYILCFCTTAYNHKYSSNMHDSEIDEKQEK